MKVGSLFAGIGGFDLGFERAGFTVAWCVEWDKNAQAVLRARFPNAKVYGDIREVDPDSLEPVDIVCGGFPCQDLSVAGKRAGLAGERSGLFHDAMRIVRRLNPRLLVLENVPGLLSSNRGLDFATVLREVGEGWDCSEVGWRVLDSQYFGVAQRRRRVFIVGGSRTGCAEQVLALAESCGGDRPSRAEARKAVASDAARCFAGSCESSVAASLQTTCHDYSRADGFNMVAHPFSPHGHYRYEDSDQSATLQDRENRQSGSTHLVAFRKSKRAQTASDDETWVDDGLANTLNGFDTGDTRTTHAIAIPIQDGREMTKSQNGLGIGSEGDPSYTIDRTGSQSIATTMVVRRLTPVECERLQGFPDGWTDIGTDKPTADSHRYKQLGNAVTVNVAEWIARRAKAALESKQGCATVAVAWAQNQVGEIRTSEIMSTVGTTGNASARTTPKIMSGMVVRRLTPVECERLQGFPDGWTNIGTSEKPTADSHRYKQLGNAVTVNVAEWIARRAKAALESNQ